MKEAELRSRLRALYPDAPADTHQAYIMALASCKEEKTMRHKRALIPLIALLLALLAVATAVAVSYTSVTQWRDMSRQAVREHVTTLYQTHQNELMTLSINDFVFDGQNFDVAVDIKRKTPDTGYFLTAKTIATADGAPYLLDVEGSRGGDFLIGFFFPDAWDERTPEQMEAEGFGFDGVLMDEDGNPPPDGQDISWVMTFQVLKPLWPVEALKQEDYFALDEDALRLRCREAWENQRILYTGGDLTEYALYAGEAADITQDELWTLDKPELLVRLGAFDRTDTVVCRFSTSLRDDVRREEMEGQRFDLGEYALQVERFDLSFQRLSLRMRFDFGRPLALMEAQTVKVPRQWEVRYNGSNQPAEGGIGCAQVNPDYGFNQQSEIETLDLILTYDDWPEDEVTSVTLVPFEWREDGAERRRVYDEEKAVTLTVR